jgi:PmbA protein
MATTLREFDSWHPANFDADRAVAIALAAEAAGREVDARIGNSDGASANAGATISVYANSHGFLGAERSTSYSIGCALIAGEGDDMQRDSWYSVALAEGDLEGTTGGRPQGGATHARAAGSALAADRRGAGAVRRGNGAFAGRPLPRRGLGGALYRKASFLLDSVGTRVFPDWFDIEERPFLPRGFRSAAFDAEGVATRESPLVRDGIVQRYVLGSYSARKLGLQTTANAGGVHNLQVRANAGGLMNWCRAWAAACWSPN